MRRYYTSRHGLLAHDTPRMPVCSRNYHLVWCPKYRRPVLTDRVEKRFAELIRKPAALLDMMVNVLDMTPDHVHLSKRERAGKCSCPVNTGSIGHAPKPMRVATAARLLHTL
jgi:hypothetical protein